MNWRRLGASVGLLVLTNAVVLAGVAYNRSGEPEVEITLTERELPVALGTFGGRDEDTGSPSISDGKARIGAGIPIGMNQGPHGLIKPNSRPWDTTVQFLSPTPTRHCITIGSCHGKSMWSWNTEDMHGLIG